MICHSPGTFANTSGLSSCSPCTACAPTATQLAPCSAISNNASCVCNTGYVGDGYACGGCAAGRYAAQGVCAQCPAGI